jgi:hypothetical protein
MFESPRVGRLCPVEGKQRNESMGERGQENICSDQSDGGAFSTVM